MGGGGADGHLLEGFDLASVQTCPPHQNVRTVAASAPPSPSPSSPSRSLAAPRLQDSKGSEKGKKIDSEWRWRRAPTPRRSVRSRSIKACMFTAGPAPGRRHRAGGVGEGNVWAERLLRVKMKRKKVTEGDWPHLWRRYLFIKPRPSPMVTRRWSKQGKSAATGWEMGWVAARDPSYRGPVLSGSPIAGVEGGKYSGVDNKAGDYFSTCR